MFFYTLNEGRVSMTPVRMEVKGKEERERERVKHFGSLLGNCDICAGKKNLFINAMKWYKIWLRTKT